MIFVKLVGGLGNQMFQYAAAKSLSLKLNCPLFLDIHDFKRYPDRNYDLHVFHNIKDDFCSKALHDKIYSKSFLTKALRNFRHFKIYKEPHFNVDHEFFKLKTDTHISGYFQSQDYFIDHETTIRTLFERNEDLLSELSKDYLKAIINTDSVSIHFRRGDYISDPKANEVHGICTLDYYKKAISFFLEKNSNLHFFIFSDDITWVKEQNLFSTANHTYIHKSDDTHDSEEMYLMSKCQHNIVANSSFSWWGAWLNKHEQKKVIAPSQWFQSEDFNTKDLIPANWIRL